ncbi:MAG: hypothetical protein MSS84_07660 [Bacteroidales bacterium]|nr:hypothetical protein [Bacteroidales bacterium]
MKKTIYVLTAMVVMMTAVACEKTYKEDKNYLAGTQWETTLSGRQYPAKLCFDYKGTWRILVDNGVSFATGTFGGATGYPSGSFGLHVEWVEPNADYALCSSFKFISRDGEYDGTYTTGSSSRLTVLGCTWMYKGKVAQ